MLWTYIIGLYSRHPIKVNDYIAYVSLRRNGWLAESFLERISF